MHLTDRRVFSNITNGLRYLRKPGQMSSERGSRSSEKTDGRDTENLNEQGKHRGEKEDREIPDGDANFGAGIRGDGVESRAGVNSLDLMSAGAEVTEKQKSHAFAFVTEEPENVRIILALDVLEVGSAEDPG